MDFGKLVIKLESSYNQSNFVSTICANIAHFKLTTEEYEVLANKIIQKCSVHSRIGLIIDTTDCKVNLSLVHAFLHLSKILNNENLEHWSCQLLENYIINFDFKIYGFPNDRLNLSSYKELFDNLALSEVNHNWENELRSDFLLLFKIYKMYPNEQLYEFLLSRPIELKKFSVDFGYDTKNLSELFSEIKPEYKNNIKVNYSTKSCSETNKKFAENILSRPFKRTFLLLRFIISPKKINKFLRGLSNSKLDDYVECLASFISQCEEYLSEDIYERIKELYHYEKECWNLLCQVENMQLDLRRELIHEKQKQLFFNSSKQDFFGFNLVLSPLIKIIDTQWRWAQNAAWDTENNFPPKQLLMPTSNFMNCMVVSSFSKDGFYEYILNDWDKRLMELFQANPSIETNYNAFSENFSLSSQQEENRLYSTTREFIEKLVDRNILMVKKTAK